MSESTFSIRPATDDDLQEVLKIEKVAYPLPWTKKHFQEELKSERSHFLVYTDDQTDSFVAGYIVFQDFIDETHILNVAVDLKWRGLGMGKKLVGYAINEAYRKSHKRVVLEVRQENIGAIAMYQSLGFEKRHIRTAFYADGASALFMELVLQGGVSSENESVH